ncbi:hypothetical protein DM02DRAFT_616278 [Periconia macrospinosa]|uniref:Fms interacting protein n=1 Tax=Periconia macrospinosa TaxID=97972 RepID=A0A2V1DKN3_9PLEO|nr:hypothetical protein DM02DRAFT_616278 [Periconia macrospinosa]
MPTEASKITLDQIPTDFDPTNLIVADLIETDHCKRLYDAIQDLKRSADELVDYQLAHPQNPNPSTPEEIEKEKKVEWEIAQKERVVKSQLSRAKTYYRQSVMKVREEKAKTADDKAVNDTLILGLSNLKYEEQSLRSEIAAAENYDHEYTKLPLIPVEEFLDKFPEHSSSSDHELMIARIDHEHRDRVKLEERRQEKLKQKQKLIAEVKKSKENLTNLDSMYDKIEEAMAPIRKVLANDE